MLDDFIVVLARTTEANLRIEFVEITPNGAKLKGWMPFKEVRSLQHLESIAHLWPITKRLPVEALLVSVT